MLLSQREENLVPRDGIRYTPLTLVSTLLHICIVQSGFEYLGLNTYLDFLYFISGDLTISVFVLYNYLEANSRVPWEDLRYLFGEIMYGGHITDDWDRRLCNAYLEELMQPDLVSDLFLLFPYWHIVIVKVS